MTRLSTNKTKLVVVGCSGSSGTGWDKDNISADSKTAPELWINLCHQNLYQFKCLHLINAAFAGASNLQIFKSAITMIGTFGSEISHLICQWTKLHRHTLSVGLEFWPTDVKLSAPETKDINTINFKLKRKKINEYQQTIKAIIHPHKEIIDLLQYVNVINQLGTQLGIVVYHVNSKCPWDQGYFDYKVNQNLLPSDLTFYTQKKILFSDQRSDLETFQLYKKMFDDYHSVGGVAEHSWINLYNPFYHPTNLVDYNYDNLHAGQQSNENFFNIVKTKLGS